MSFTRDDIKEFFRNSYKQESAERRIQLLKECGCDDPENQSLYGDDSLYASTYGQYPFNPEMQQRYQQHREDLAHTAMCPESYKKTADIMIQVPGEVVDMLKPLMQQFGVGCPQSFAQAIADVMDMAMKTDVVKPFHVD
mgnify:CR=1 FL=1